MDSKPARCGKDIINSDIKLMVVIYADDTLIMATTMTSKSN